MKLFPSYIASMITGAIWFPIYLKSAMYLSDNKFNDLLQILWGLVGFVLPILFSTGDVKYLKKRARKSIFGWFSPMPMNKETLNSFFIPAWTRMFIFFLSAVASLIFLKASGIMVFGK